jgi:hypothetical protein
MTTTRIDYGNDLYELVRQPTGTVEMDAYGLVQAQATFACDVSIIPTVLGTFATGQPYPDSLGFDLTSYRYRVTTQKAGVAMVTVDYIGVNRESGYSDVHMQGVVNTSAQPIETHPNFTKITDAAISSNVLAGVPSAKFNNAIFGPTTDKDTGTVQYQFKGFGVSTTALTVNRKAGVRQYLKPMTTVRGTIYFRASQSGKAEKLSSAIGCYLKTADSQSLINPWLVYGVIYGSRWLVTAANIEPMGTPASSHLDSPVIKVTYDLMYGGLLGWDPDIYGQAESIF